MSATESFWIKLLHFYIYSSIHISLGAISLLYVTATLYNIIIPLHYYLLLFSSTLFIYCLHRIVGIEKVFQFEQKGRFAIIHKYKHHLVIYTIFGAVSSLVLFFKLQLDFKFWFIVPGIISVLYTLPILMSKKRLRDFNYLKIFLIGFVWAFTTGLVPALIGKLGTLETILIVVERICFIIAITIPFDIRDAKIDDMISVRTIVSLIGTPMSIALSIVLLIICAGIQLYFFTQSVFNLSQFGAQLICYFIAAIFIYKYSRSENDLVFSGLLDGSMILLAALIWTVSHL